MQFFTPELYLRFNSTDDEVADRAYQEWEDASKRYGKQLASFREELPSQIRKLTELSLHDARVLSRGEEIQASGAPIPSEELFSEIPMRFWIPNWTAIYVVTVKDEETIRSLIYCLRDVVQTRSSRDWPFSREGEHWLYDEVEIVRSSRLPVLGYVHRILLSTGIELEIPFTTLFIHEFSLAKIGQEVGQ